jgi:hypothetical protein
VRKDNSKGAEEVLQHFYVNAPTFVIARNWCFMVQKQLFASVELGFLSAKVATFL